MLLDKITQLLDSIKDHPLPATNDSFDTAALRLAIWKLVKDRATKEYDALRQVFVEKAQDEPSRTIHASRLVEVTVTRREGRLRLDRDRVVRYALTHGLDPDEFIEQLSVKGEDSVAINVAVKV